MALIVGSATANVPTTSASTQVAASNWDDQVWDLLELILIRMRYPQAEAGAGSLDLGLVTLVNDWNSLGLPGGLSPDDAKLTVEALDALEAMLVEQPERVSPELLPRAFETIQSMRRALLELCLTAPNGGGR